jgi:hypothetical protein
MNYVKKKNINNFEKFKEINYQIDKIYLFDNKNLKKKYKSNQLFSKVIPPFELVQNIFFLLINKDLVENIYYEFTIKILIVKKIIDKIDKYIDILKEYYLKCKHKKYLENLNEKKIITVFRQILYPYDYLITSFERYDSSEKYTLYILEKKKSIIIKKIDSTINFD